MRQKVVVVVPDGGSLFEISHPAAGVGPDPMEPGWPAVDVIACAVTAAVRRAMWTWRAATVARRAAATGRAHRRRRHGDRADLAIDGRAVPPTVLTALRAAAAREVRIVGLCLGAYVLAEAGLLDGRTAVTHWRWADDFAARFPRSPWTVRRSTSTMATW